MIETPTHTPKKGEPILFDKLVVILLGSQKKSVNENWEERSHCDSQLGGEISTYYMATHFSILSV